MLKSQQTIEIAGNITICAFVLKHAQLLLIKYAYLIKYADLIKYAELIKYADLVKCADARAGS